MRIAPSIWRPGAKHTSAPRPALTLPGNARAIEELSAQCRKLVAKRALMSAGAVLVPVPGLDIAADIALLMRLIDEINRAFGLTHESIERLSPGKRVLVYRALVAVGGMMAGKVVTRELVVRALGTVGVRLTTKQAAKYVPLAGQALAAGISFTAMRYVGLQHIKDCERVVRAVIASDA
jgi:uncharacterized protein (DUF697 family)